MENQTLQEALRQKETYSSTIDAFRGQDRRPVVLAAGSRIGRHKLTEGQPDATVDDRGQYETPDSIHRAIKKRDGQVGGNNQPAIADAVAC